MIPMALPTASLLCARIAWTPASIGTSSAHKIRSARLSSTTIPMPSMLLSKRKRSASSSAMPSACASVSFVRADGADGLPYVRCRRWDAKERELVPKRKMERRREEVSLRRRRRTFLSWRWMVVVLLALEMFLQTYVSKRMSFHEGKVRQRLVLLVRVAWEKEFDGSTCEREEKRRVEE